MSTLPDRPHTALLVIDVQNGVVGEAFRRDEVVAGVTSLVDRARSESVPVVWVQHNNSEHLPRDSAGWQLVDGLAPAGDEHVVHKQYGDAFEDTDLEQVLDDLAVGRLVVAGAETDECIRCTIHSGFTRGYDVTLVSDAHTAGDKSEWGAPPVEQVIAHTNLYWSFQEAPGRTAGTAEAASVTF